VYSLIALHVRGYPLEHPVIRKGLEGLERFTIEDGTRRLEACQSPVWDTALALVALADADVGKDHPARVRAAEWLVHEQILGRGDWAVRRPALEPGGLALRTAAPPDAKPKSICDGAPATAPTSPSGASPGPPTYTGVFGEALVREARQDARVIGITAAMASGTGLNILQRELPDRYFDVGITEQQAVLFAAGLALSGCKPVAAIYSTFLQRAYDQIVHDVCVQKLNVIFAMDRAGLVGDDGATHHGAFDIAYLRSLPNIILMAPRDEAMLVHMLHSALRHDAGPIALRYPRGPGVGIALPERPSTIDIGIGVILRDVDRVALLGYGKGVGKALEAADILGERGVAVTVADARFAKPIDAGLAAQLAAEHELLVTVEEGVLAGGFGSAVWEANSDAGVMTRILRVGLPDSYVTHGAPKLLHRDVGFTGERIVERIEAAVRGLVMTG
jgi:1-deoxy-D-xylulose-5-phosphate synthase